MIATARIVMPKAMVRLSAGRVRFSQPEQVLSLTCDYLVGTMFGILWSE